MDTQDIIDTLNDLIETCKDGEYGFRSCAEHARSTTLKTLLNRHADECRQGAAELQALVAQRGGRAEEGGSASGALHRGWVSLKGTLAGHSDVAMLEEVERGEDVAIERYRDVLQRATLPADLLAVVQRQYDGLKRNHVEMRSLRDQARAAG
ncbi:MAG: PA2169 family four-helix-bundle protein [Ideonella sp.]|nr:PA2169 family four-helix-bundle protein [Ideonella sp.]